MGKDHLPISHFYDVDYSRMERQILKYVQKHVAEGASYPWGVLDELIVKEETMNKNTGEIIDYGKASVIDHKGNAIDGEVLPPSDPNVVKVEQSDITALNKMGYGAHMAWWRRNRPTLDQMTKNPAGLSSSQQKSMDKKARKRAANLASMAKQK